MDYTVHGILQTRILERVAIPFSRGSSSQPTDQTRSPSLQVDSLPAEPPGKPKNTGVGSLSLLQWIKLGSSCITGRFFTNWVWGKHHLLIDPKPEHFFTSLQQPQANWTTLAAAYLTPLLPFLHVSFFPSPSIYFFNRAYILNMCMSTHVCLCVPTHTHIHTRLITSLSWYKSLHCN